MKKTVLVLVIILLVFSLVGCKDKESMVNNTQENKVEGEKEKEQSEEKTDIKTDSDQEDITVTVEELKNLPEHFIFFDYVDDTHFVGLTKSKLFLYSVEDQETEILSESNYWNIKLSPDKKLIAWRNEEGLGIYDLENKKEELIFTNEDMKKVQRFNGSDPGFYVNDYIWSPDSQKLLLIMHEEFGCSHGILSIEDKSLQIIEYRDIMGAVDWSDDNKILFELSYMKAKDKDEWSTDSAFRTDLVLYDIDSNEFITLTDNKDGEFVRVLDKKDDIVYFTICSSDKQELFTLELDTRKIEKVSDIDGEVLVVKDKDNYIIGIDKGKDELNNSIMELQLVSKDNSHKLSEWKYDGWMIQTFLFEDSLFISSYCVMETDNNSITTKDRAAVINFK